MVDYPEFLTAAFDKKKLLTADKLDRAFRFFDEDGDGQISREELEKIFGCGAMPSEQFDKLWREIMAEVDQDKDGLISETEFKERMLDVISKRATFYREAIKQ